jgi:Protein of unknown function (DUF4065)
MNRAAHKLTYRVELPGGDGRLREMILYVSQKAAEMPRYGKTKLNKILWDADFSAFAARGIPITGRAYQKLAAGPAPIEMPTILAEMKDAGLIDIEFADFGGGVIEQRIIAKVDPALRFFSADDLSFMDRSIERLWAMSARQASDFSHGVAWKTREDLDPLPYESAIFSDEELSGEPLTRIKERAYEQGWKSS